MLKVRDEQRRTNIDYYDDLRRGYGTQRFSQAVHAGWAAACFTTRQPLALFEQWQADAAAAGLADPTGCVVATVQPSGMVRQRFVLLKGVDEQALSSTPITTVIKRQRSRTVIKPRCCSRGTSLIVKSVFQER